MRTKDLRIAAMLTAVCLLLSFGASYSYVHGWRLTQGVTPLALTIALVLSATAFLELVRSPSKVKDYLTNALPMHGLLWFLLIALDAYVSLKLGASRRKYVEGFSRHHA